MKIFQKFIIWLYNLVYPDVRRNKYCIIYQWGKESNIVFNIKPVLMSNFILDSLK